MWLLAKLNWVHEIGEFFSYSSFIYCSFEFYVFPTCSHSCRDLRTSWSFLRGSFSARRPASHCQGYRLYPWSPRRPTWSVRLTCTRTYGGGRDGDTRTDYGLPKYASLPAQPHPQYFWLISLFSWKFGEWASLGRVGVFRQATSKFCGWERKTGCMLSRNVTQFPFLVAIKVHWRAEWGGLF